MDTSKKMKIFLVDDDVFSLHLCEKNIRNLEYTDISLFQNGTDCLNSLTQNPDVIFLDYNMDILNGFEVLKKIKRAIPNTYVVMLSSQETIKTAVESLKYGAFDYLIKGDNQNAKIADVLNRIEGIQELLKKSKPGVLRKLFSLI